MNFREFVKKRYDLVRESGAFGTAVLVHVVLIILAFSITFSTSQVVRDKVKAFFKQEEKRKIEQPKPVVLPKDIPIMPPQPPKVERMQKLTERMTIKNPPKTMVRPKPLTDKRKTQLDFKNLSKLGDAVRGQMYGDYRTRHGVEGAGKTVRAVIEKFVVVAYEGGDWDCEFHHPRGGEVDFTKGSIPNLIREIERRTNIDVSNKVPIAVRADSPEIHRSPFVYFTGHKDFTLTEVEVENLRTYVLQGGAIVANSSLPGRRSRFDVAFRREMKRVIPDHDLKPINEKHEIFKSFAIMPGAPVGMNYWQEPLEVIEIDNRVVVIYNLNGYGDLMLATLDETGNAIKMGLSAQDGTYRFQGPRIWQNTRNLYANVEDVPTVINAYMMNINILTYLLTR
ncbi:DUF4159 domain-containing protein [bacterium]|nr:DUF4159 domain-containing protein [bacterium]